MKLLNLAQCFIRVRVQGLYVFIGNSELESKRDFKRYNDSSAAVLVKIIINILLT